MDVQEFMDHNSLKDATRSDARCYGKVLEAMDSGVKSYAGDSASKLRRAMASHGARYMSHTELDLPVTEMQARYPFGSVPLHLLNGDPRRCHDPPASAPDLSPPPADQP